MKARMAHLKRVYEERVRPNKVQNTPESCVGNIAFYEEWMHWQKEANS